MKAAIIVSRNIYFVYLSLNAHVITKILSILSNFISEPMDRKKAATALGTVVLLPMLTVAGLPNFVDKKKAYNEPVQYKSSAADCMSTTALLTFRGLGAGLAWTFAVDAYLLASMPGAVSKEVAKQNGSSVRRDVIRSLGSLCKRNMLGFAGFLGIFAGVSCSFENARGRNDLLNPFAGGFTAAMVYMRRELRNPRALLTSAFMCGSASMALHHFVPVIGNNQNEGSIAKP